MADPRMYPRREDNGRSSADPAASPSAGRRLYNPYQDLSNIPYKSLYDLPTSPEFLFQEEALVQRRSWGENLTYYTGIGYLSGAAAGAAVGLRDAARAAEPGETAKIRANRVLNSCGGAGRRVGNRLGVIGLLYAGIESRHGREAGRQEIRARPLMRYSLCCLPSDRNKKSDLSNPLFVAEDVISLFYCCCHG